MAVVDAGNTNKEDKEIDKTPVYVRVCEREKREFERQGRMVTERKGEVTVVKREKRKRGSELNDHGD